MITRAGNGCVREAAAGACGFDEDQGLGFAFGCHCRFFIESGRYYNAGAHHLACPCRQASGLWIAMFTWSWNRFILCLNIIMP